MIKWSEKFNTGNPIIDAQHKRLFEIAAEAEALFIEDSFCDKYDEIIKCVLELQDYTSYHFSCEERLMELSGYEKISEHKEMHKECIDEIAYILSTDIDTNQKEVLRHTLEFILTWITEHIQNIDQTMVKSL